MGAAARRSPATSCSASPPTACTPTASASCAPCSRAPRHRTRSSPSPAPPASRPAPRRPATTGRRHGGRGAAHPDRHLQPGAARPRARLRGARRRAHHRRRLSRQRRPHACPTAPRPSSTSAPGGRRPSSPGCTSLGVTADEMLSTFNCGLGMVLALPADERAEGARDDRREPGLRRRVVGEVVARRSRRPGRALQGRARSVRSYDLIGCGALNLDLIYRLPADSPLWGELPPPGAEQAIGADAARRASTRPWPRSSRPAAAAARRPTPPTPWRAWASAPPCWAASAPTTTAASCSPSWPRRRPLPGPRAARRAASTCCSTRPASAATWCGRRPTTSSAPADLPRRLPQTRFAYFSSFVGERPLQAQLALLERLPADVEIAFDPGEIYARHGVKRFMPLPASAASYLFATESELETALRPRLPTRR